VLSVLRWRGPGCQITSPFLPPVPRSHTNTLSPSLPSHTQALPVSLHTQNSHTCSSSHTLCPCFSSQTEEDVCFVCYDGGDLVVCDIRYCPLPPCLPTVTHTLSLCLSSHTHSPCLFSDTLPPCFSSHTHSLFFPHRHSYICLPLTHTPPLFLLTHTLPLFLLTYTPSLSLLRPSLFPVPFSYPVPSVSAQRATTLGALCFSSRTHSLPVSPHQHSFAPAFLSCAVPSATARRATTLGAAAKPRSTSMLTAPSPAVSELYKKQHSTLYPRARNTSMLAAPSPAVSVLQFTSLYSTAVHFIIAFCSAALL